MAALPANQTLPTVFLLGEFDERYEEIMPGYATLLDVCDGDMNFAYDKLLGMMKEMEAYATLTDYDLKGVNAWMHFFWRADGGIEHIGFYLKPNSKNVNTEALRNFLAGFAKQYKLPMKVSKSFSHYSSFSFPLIVHSQVPTPDGDKNTAKKIGHRGY
ncbi:MAG: hypothetical protein HY842_01630 [Bacteroidetes bacterium]|nr:hypothetical protein [Bacteroidota bacterium]